MLSGGKVLTYCRCSREGVKTLCRETDYREVKQCHSQAKIPIGERTERVHKILQETFHNKSHLPRCKTKQTYAIYLSGRGSLNSLEEKTTRDEAKGKEEKTREPGTRHKFIPLFCSVRICKSSKDTPIPQKKTSSFPQSFPGIQKNHILSLSLVETFSTPSCFDESVHSTISVRV